MDVAALGHLAARERLADLAACGEVRREAGYVAVRTGLDSNDLNGVVADAGFRPEPAVVAGLVGWFAGVPAQWLAAGPDPWLTAVLVAAGLTPERTGHWCGRAVGPHVPAPGVERVATVAEWSPVAQACGWGERPAYDLAQRPHWVARRDGRAVGVASGWIGEACELVDVAVLPTARRTGVGTALVETVLAWAAASGAREVVAAPSPDGWALLSGLGFEAAPVVPDVAFYLP